MSRSTSRRQRNGNPNAETCAAEVLAQLTRRQRFTGAADESSDRMLVSRNADVADETV